MQRGVFTQNALFHSQQCRRRLLPNSRRYYKPLRSSRHLFPTFCCYQDIKYELLKATWGLRCEGSWTSQWLTSEHTLPHTVWAQQNPWLAWEAKEKKQNNSVTQPWLNADSSLKTEPRAKRQETLGFSVLHFWNFYEALKWAAVWACPEKSWPFSIWNLCQRCNIGVRRDATANLSLFF